MNYPYVSIPAMIVERELLEQARQDLERWAMLANVGLEDKEPSAVQKLAYMMLPKKEI